MLLVKAEATLASLLTAASALLCTTIHSIAIKSPFGACTSTHPAVFTAAGQKGGIILRLKAEKFTQGFRGPYINNIASFQRRLKYRSSNRNFAINRTTLRTLLIIREDV